jgi:hypothetical protein
MTDWLAACDIPNAEQPFACLDLTFIAAFLHNGYRLKPESPIKVSHLLQ